MRDLVIVGAGVAGLAAAVPHYAAYPVPVTLGGRRTLAGVGVDASVAPSHQGRRLWTPLAKAVYADAAEHGMPITMCFPNVASTSGALNKYSDEVRTRFLSAKSEEDVTAIMRDFATAVEQGREKEAGFPSAAYAVSKAGCIAGTEALARQERESGGKRKRGSMGRLNIKKR